MLATALYRALKSDTLISTEKGGMEEQVSGVGVGMVIGGIVVVVVVAVAGVVDAIAKETTAAWSVGWNVNV